MNLPAYVAGPHQRRAGVPGQLKVGARGERVEPMLGRIR